MNKYILSALASLALITSIQAQVSTYTGMQKGTSFIDFCEKMDKDSAALASHANVLSLSSSVTALTPIADFLATPTSSTLATALSDENGTGGMLLADGTIVIPNGKTVTFDHTSTFTTTDAAVYTFPASSKTLASLTGTETLTNKTLTSPTMTTPTLGVASATSLATSAASPFLLTNGQLITIALTSQTSGAATLTIPDFAGVADEFVFKTKSVTMSNKTFVAPVLGVATGTSVAVTAGITSAGPTGAGIGYATGAGGTVTQITSRTTTVVLSKLTGQITTTADSMAAQTPTVFTVTNTTVAATDNIIVTKVSGDTDTDVTVQSVGSGSFTVKLFNTHASAADTTAFVFNFGVIKGVTS